ncbi:MAG: GtrA family protein [bacterium]|nr:GtrA family protein [bacterium]
MAIPHKHPPSTVLRLVRFAATGAINTAVDFAILNILFLLYLWIADIPLSDGWYMTFKGLSFCAAVVNSWFLNKNWVFADAAPADKPGKNKAMFLVVSTVGFGVNVAVSLLAFSGFQSLGTFGVTASANMGALFGTAAALITNFIGYRLLVFKSINITTYEPTNISVGDHTRV